MQRQPHQPRAFSFDGHGLRAATCQLWIIRLHLVLVNILSKLINDDDNRWRAFSDALHDGRRSNGSHTFSCRHVASKQRRPRRKAFGTPFFVTTDRRRDRRATSINGAGDDEGLTRIE